MLLQHTDDLLLAEPLPLHPLVLSVRARLQFNLD